MLSILGTNRAKKTHLARIQEELRRPFPPHSHRLFRNLGHLCLPTTPLARDLCTYRESF
jgi:hypothetical protein